MDKSRALVKTCEQNQGLPFWEMYDISKPAGTLTIGN